MMSALFDRELGLPVRGRSERVTRRPRIEPGETFVCFDETGPGCVLHWWLATLRKGNLGWEHEPVHHLQLRLYEDGKTEPAIDLPLAKFFGILFDHDIYMIGSAAVTILPTNALNCYLPIPFRRLRIELTNRGVKPCVIWFMADWQRYAADTPLTGLHLRVIHRGEYPAEPAGSFLMADLNGSGFVAGMFKGVRVRDRSDSWYHSGGDLWLIDGESSPRALRGIGGEDIFNMSYGIWDRQTPWVGAPLIKKTADDNALGSGYEGVMYRFFGPDPVWFDHSAVVRFGSKANDIESLVYAYVEPSSPPSVLSVPEWKLAGPFACTSRADFERDEWADGSPSTWPETHAAAFGQYVVDDRPAEFPVPVRAAGEHGWCDLARHFRGRAKTNVGTQPRDVSAYAAGTLTIPEAGEYVLRIGFDDWLRCWIDGELVCDASHENRFDVVETAPLHLSAGGHEIRVKLSNADNAQWRLWAFCLTTTAK